MKRFFFLTVLVITAATAIGCSHTDKARKSIMTAKDFNGIIVKIFAPFSILSLTEKFINYEVAIETQQVQDLELEKYP